MALLALYGEDFAYMDACLEFLESIMTPLASGGIGAVGVINCLSLPVTIFKSSGISSKLKNCLVGLGVESKDKPRMRITEKESYAPTKFRWIFVWYVGTTSSLLIYIGFLLSYGDTSQDFALAFFTTGSFLVAISIVFRIIAELCWPKEKQCARA